jgi:hypothetical protein
MMRETSSDRALGSGEVVKDGGNDIRLTITGALSASTRAREASGAMLNLVQGQLELRRKRILDGLRAKQGGIRTQAPLAALKPEVAVHVSAVYV